MCIVPVSTKYGNNGKKITTCAIIDDCIHNSFVHEIILKQLGGY